MRVAMNWEMLSAIGQVVAAVALWEEVERTMIDYFAYPGAKEWWATRKHWLTDEFRAVVDAMIAKNPEPKMYADYGLDEASNQGRIKN